MKRQSLGVALGLVVCAAASSTSSAAAQQVDSGVVLHVRSQAPGPQLGSIALTLRSGTVIVVSWFDIDDALSAAATGTITRENAAQDAKDAAFRAAGAGPQPIIRAKCAKDWPDDFTLRAYCERTQTAAVEKLQTRSMTSADQRTIHSKCLKDWPDDFALRNYCEETQLKALTALGR